MKFHLHNGVRLPGHGRRKGNNLRSNGTTAGMAWYNWGPAMEKNDGLIWNEKGMMSTMPPRPHGYNQANLSAPVLPRGQPDYRPSTKCTANPTRAPMAAVMRQKVDCTPPTATTTSCPRCQGPMRVISSIEDTDVIEKILKHLGLWLVKPKVQPRANAPPSELHIDYSDSQMPPFDDYPCTDTKIDPHDAQDTIEWTVRGSNIHASRDIDGKEVDTNTDRSLRKP